MPIEIHGRDVHVVGTETTADLPRPAKVVHGPRRLPQNATAFDYRVILTHDQVVRLVKEAIANRQDHVTLGPVRIIIQARG